MKITIAQQNYHVGNPLANVEKMALAVKEAVAAKSEMIIFGELSVSGYAHYDDIFYPSFMEEVENALERVAMLSEHIVIVCGAPQRRQESEGKRFHNAAYIFQKGALAHIIQKSLLPYFDIFEEEKYFERAFSNDTFMDIGGKKIAFSICADMWAYQIPNGYTFNPLKHSCRAKKPDLVINISASPFHYGRRQQRTTVIEHLVSDIGAPMIYCNIVGAYDETIFDGQSLVFDKEGRCVVEMKAFEEEVRTIDLAELATYHAPPACPFVALPQKPEEAIPFLTNPHYVEMMLRALQFSLRDFLARTRTRKIIIASSGGVDSALCLALVATVFPKEHIISLNLPSRFNSSGTQNDAAQLAENLGIRHLVMPIQSLLEQAMQTTADTLQQPVSSLTMENMQSRIRGFLLMGVANQEHALVINTSNKSEISTGYGTTYGDMIGAISPLGDVFKTQVFSLVRLMQTQGIRIPETIITRPPSAELNTNQKDSDALPSYEELDAMLYFFIHQTMDRKRLKAMGFDEGAVEKTISLFRKSRFKRKQFCPIIRVSDKAFGQGKKHLMTSAFEF